MPEQSGGKTNWKAMLRDKKLWIGAAAAGGLGLVVFLKRGGSTQGTVGPGGATGVTPVGSAGYVQGGADTTGTDIASFLSSYSTALQQQQAEYQGQIKDTITALLEGQTGGQTTPNTPNAPITDIKAGGNYASVVSGWSTPRWISDLNKIYPDLNLTESKFRELNPGLTGLTLPSGTVKVR